MNKDLFAHFYSQGIEIACSGKGPEAIDYEGGYVMPLPGNAHEYAFYFAQQCMSDMEEPKVKQWGRLGPVRGFFFKLRYNIFTVIPHRVWEFIKGVFAS